MFVGQFPSRSPAPSLVGADNGSPALGGPHVICFPFAGGTVGGSQISACKLIQSLDRKSFTPLIILHCASGQLAELLQAEGLNYQPAPSPHHFGRSPGIRRERGVRGLIRASAAQVALAAFLRAHKVRIVHTNEGPMHLSWALPAKLAGCKLLWHHRSNPDARGLRYLAPIVADQVVSVSRYALSLAGAVRDRPTSSVIYSPFDTDQPLIDRASARQELIAELGISPRTHIVGFFGNFVARKRPHLFVDMIGEIRRTAPDVPVVGLMFGTNVAEGWDEELRGRAQAKGVADCLHLMGFRYPAERWLAGCDIHAVTAVEEPFGRSLIEAMLLGTPVVAVASGGNIEAIVDGETGCLTPPEDAAAMANAIISLLHRPAKRTQLANAARADALSRFGKERHCQEVTSVYRRLLMI